MVSFAEKTLGKEEYDKALERARGRIREMSDVIRGGREAGLTEQAAIEKARPLGSGAMSTKDILGEKAYGKIMAMKDFTTQGPPAEQPTTKQPTKGRVIQPIIPGAKPGVPVGAPGSIYNISRGAAYVPGWKPGPTFPVGPSTPYDPSTQYPGGIDSPTVMGRPLASPVGPSTPYDPSTQYPGGIDSPMARLGPKLPSPEEVSRTFIEKFFKNPIDAIKYNMEMRKLYPEYFEMPPGDKEVIGGRGEREAPGRIPAPTPAPPSVPLPPPPVPPTGEEEYEIFNPEDYVYDPYLGITVRRPRLPEERYRLPEERYRML